MTVMAMSTRCGSATSSTSTSSSSTSTDQFSSRFKAIHDRKFAFLNKITKPDYRSMACSMTTSPSATPVNVTLSRKNTDPGLFPSFVAPIATPEDEIDEDDEFEIKCATAGISKNEIRNESENQTNINEGISTGNEVIQAERGDEGKDEENEFEDEMEPEIIMDDRPESDNKEDNLIDDDRIIDKNTHEDTGNETESDQEKGETIDSLENSELKQLAESFGEPSKAILERIDDTVDDEEEEEEANEFQSDDCIEESEEDFEIEDEDTNQSAGSADGLNSIDDEYRNRKPPSSLELMTSARVGLETPRQEYNKKNILLMSDEEEMDEEGTSESRDETVLQQSLIQLQKQLRKTDVRCSRLEKICELQQKDIDSLRFEVDWKDKRIEYLQKALEEMEAKECVNK